MSENVEEVKQGKKVLVEVPCLRPCQVYVRLWECCIDLYHMLSGTTTYAPVSEVTA